MTPDHLYNEDELLMLSGIQHIAFCERQYALAYIEMQWLENVLTVEGHHLHERVNDPFESESGSDIIIWRDLPVVSLVMGIYGRADIVELIKVGNKESGSIKVSGKSGWWKLLPVEYKRGKPKPDERDEVQLCAQAMCLEEMYRITISEGSLYYGQTRHRHKVEFSSSLREQVLSYVKRMHHIYTSGVTPLPIFKQHCKSCSLYELCLPKVIGNGSAGTEYLALFQI